MNISTAAAVSAPNSAPRSKPGQIIRPPLRRRRRAATRRKSGRGAEAVAIKTRSNVHPHRNTLIHNEHSRRRRRFGAEFGPPVKTQSNHSLAIAPAPARGDPPQERARGAEAVAIKTRSNVHPHRNTLIHNEYSRCRRRFGAEFGPSIKTRSNHPPRHQAQNGKYPARGRSGSATRISPASRARRITCEICAAFRALTPKRLRRLALRIHCPFPFRWRSVACW